MIDKLIKEMFSPCAHCQGCGLKLDSEGQYEHDEPCDQCGGSCEEMSYQGEVLRQIILTGEKP